MNIGTNSSIFENIDSILFKINTFNKINISSVTSVINNSLIILGSTGNNVEVNSNSNILRNINTDIRTLGVN